MQRLRPAILWANGALACTVVLRVVIDAVRHPFLLRNHENRGLMMVWAVLFAFGMLASAAVGGVFKRLLLRNSRSPWVEATAWAMFSMGAVGVHALLLWMIPREARSWLSVFALIIIPAIMAVAFAVTAWTVVIGSMGNWRTSGLQLVVWGVVAAGMSYAVWLLTGAIGHVLTHQ